MFCKKRKGFTLIEILIVIALLLVFLVLTIPFGIDFYNQQILEEETAKIVNSLKTAQSRAQSGMGDSAWGVKFLEGSYILYMGDSYGDAGRSTDYDKSFDLRSGFDLQGFEEVNFEKGTGYPTVTGS